MVVIDTECPRCGTTLKAWYILKTHVFIGTNRFDMHVSVPLVFEYEAVLFQHSEELALTPEDVADVVDAVCALAIPYKIYFLWRPYLRDRKDELVLELAVAARCDYIITYNQRDFRGAEMFGIRLSQPTGVSASNRRVAMSTLQLTLPQSMREQVEALAQKEGISIHEFITLAVAEKLATLATADYLTERAKRGSREKLLAVLAKAPDVEPEDF